jgi:triacylglycerol lipase
MTFPVELPTGSYLDAPLARATLASGYGFETARALAWLSQLAYETRDHDKVADVLKAWGLALVARLKSPAGVPGLTDTDGLVVSGWGATIIAFTGTDPLVAKDWLTDFRATLSPDDIHAGFQAGVDAVWAQVLSALGQRGDSGERLFITGHSLGGALAAVTAHRLSRQIPAVEVDAVYTFGMPRCGGERFFGRYESLLGARTYRFVHGDDVVPTLLQAQFRHVGRLLQCPHGGLFQGLRPPDTASDEPRLAGSAGRTVRRTFAAIISMMVPASTQPGLLGWLYRWLPPSIGDHLPSRYLRALGFDLVR